MLTATILLATATMTHAANWQEVDRSINGEVTSIDTASIMYQRSGLIVIWRKVNFSGERVANGTPYRSLLASDVYDCRTRTTRLMQMTLYAGENQQGKASAYPLPPAAGNVAPGTIGETTMQFVCGLTATGQPAQVP